MPSSFKCLLHICLPSFFVESKCVFIFKSSEFSPTLAYSSFLHVPNLNCRPWISCHLNGPPFISSDFAFFPSQQLVPPRRSWPSYEAFHPRWMLLDHPVIQFHCGLYSVISVQSPTNARPHASSGQYQPSPQDIKYYVLHAMSHCYTLTDCPLTFFISQTSCWFHQFSWMTNVLLPNLRRVQSSYHFHSLLLNALISVNICPLCPCVLRCHIFIVHQSKLPVTPEIYALFFLQANTR